MNTLWLWQKLGAKSRLVALLAVLIKKTAAREGTAGVAWHSNCLLHLEGNVRHSWFRG
jgi:hypothetical protein